MAVTAAINISRWSAGQHLLQVNARDRAGNRSAASLVSIIVAPSDGLFADGFETGLTRWSLAHGRSRLAVTTSRVPVGSTALRATISGATPSYVQDNTPAAERKYRARFWFDPQGTRTTRSGHDVLTGLNGNRKTIFRVQYRRTARGVRQVRAAAAVSRRLPGQVSPLDRMPWNFVGQPGRTAAFGW